MTRFIVRRLLLTIPVLFGVIFVVFAAARILPGDPCRAQLGERATDAVCADFNRRNGYDLPIPVQFTTYLGKLAEGDLGASTKTSLPVTQLLVQRLPLTLELTVYALAFALLVGIPLGIISAYKRNSPIDVVTMMVANLGVSIPIFVLGLLLAFVFGLLLRGTPFALPPSGRLTSGVSIRPLVEVWGLQALAGPPRVLLDFTSNIYSLNALITGQWNVLADAFRHMILPAVALGTIPLAIIARITRSSLLDVLGQDYIRTARAKGLPDIKVVTRHGVPNAMLPVVTVIGLQLGGLLAGAVLTETIFNLAGVGLAVYDAITGRDFAVIQGFTVVIAVVYLLVNLAVDVSYARLDPRIRLS
ncbi:MAG: ABC transporter permease [Chloroflexi bacterium]|nr:ABC transporter permease [Chloroflexota bacterium]